MENTAPRGARRGGDAVAGRSLPDVLEKALATIPQLPYDDVLLQGVPPGEKIPCLPFQQDTPWTIYLQSEGGPGSSQCLREPARTNRMGTGCIGEEGWQMREGGLEWQQATRSRR
jgi:hypothetical protein